MVSGLILIILLSMLFKYVHPDRWFNQAREQLKENEGVRDPSCGMDVDPSDAETVTLQTETGTE